MAEESELASNVLDFARRSFGYERSVEWEGTRLARFARTETESESQFRPRLVRLNLVVPADWVLVDLSADLLRLGRDGRPGGPRAGGEALEVSAEASEFSESGIDFRRGRLASGDLLYAPVDWWERLMAPELLELLGLAGPDSPTRNSSNRNKRSAPAAPPDATE